MAVRDTGWGPELEAGASHFGAVESSVKCKVTRENLTQAAEMFYEASMHEGYSQEELSAKPSSKMTAYGLFGYQVMVLGPLDETGQYIEKPSSLVITEMSQDQAEAQPKTHYKAQAFFVHLGNTFMTAEGPTELEAKTKLVSKVSAKIRSFLEKPSPEGKTAFGWVPVG